MAYKHIGTVLGPFPTIDTDSLIVTSTASSATNRKTERAHAPCQTQKARRRREQQTAPDSLNVHRNLACVLSGLPFDQVLEAGGPNPTSRIPQSPAPPKQDGSPHTMQISRKTKQRHLASPVLELPIMPLKCHKTFELAALGQRPFPSARVPLSTTALNRERER